MDGSHCSDVLSLANNTTVVGTVAPKLMEFIAYWVQSPSYRAIFSKVIPPEWAWTHQPILSQHGHAERRFTRFKGPELLATLPPPPRDDHVLYTKFSFGQPRGLLSPCYRLCNQGTSSKQLGKAVHMTCDGCLDRWWVPTYWTEPSSLGHGLVTVRYPQDIYPLSLGDRNSRHCPSKAAPTQKQPKGKSTKGRTSRNRTPRSHASPAIKSHPASPTSVSLHPPLPEVVNHSSSQPIASSSASPPPSPRPLTIRTLPHSISTSELSAQMPSLSGGSRSTTATPPPPSPQEPPVAQGVVGPRLVQKRTSSDTLHHRLMKRPRQDGGE